MTKSVLLTFVSAAATAGIFTQVKIEAAQRPPAPQFTFTDASGKRTAVDVVDRYQSKKIAKTAARSANGLDPRLARAATIAQERANAHSRRKCWAYVKDALLASGVVGSRPETEFAKQAGDELVHKFGFKKLSVRDPYKAPVGSVLVYTAKGAPGHVEIRTPDGFASDFRSKTPSPRPLLGVFAKS